MSSADQNLNWAQGGPLPRNLLWVKKGNRETWGGGKRLSSRMSSRRTLPTSKRDPPHDLVMLNGTRSRPRSSQTEKKSKGDRGELTCRTTEG